MNRIFKVADVNRVEEKEEPDLTWKGGRFSTIYVLVAVTLSLLCIYAIFRGTSLFNPGYRWFDHLFAALLLMAEFFILFHGIGYLLVTIKATKGYKIDQGSYLCPPERAPCSCHHRQLQRGSSYAGGYRDWAAE